MSTDPPCTRCKQQPPGTNSGGLNQWVQTAVSLATKVVAVVIGNWLS